MKNIPAMRNKYIFRKMASCLSKNKIAFIHSGSFNGFLPQSRPAGLRAYFPIIAFLLLSTMSHTLRSQDFSIKVGVEEVRVDAVVLDKEGLQVTDLKADDFAVYQNGKPQKIESCTYVSHSKKKDSSNLQGKTPESKSSKDLAPRAIAFLINGAGADPRSQLMHFVESQMEPDDLVGILGVGPPIFTSDKRELLARIGNINGRFGCSEAIAQDAFAAANSIISGTPSSAIFDRIIDTRTDESIIQQFKAEIAPIRYAIRAMQELPGRKHLIVTRESIFSDARKLPKVQNQLLDELANEAWRAGVVISAWDYCNAQIGTPYGRFNILFRKTGGIYTDKNQFLYKDKPALDVFKGYYLLSYIPPKVTFESKKQDKHFKISVHVNRSGLNVLSRDGFFGGFPDQSKSVSVPQTNSLRQATYSPLLFNDMKLSLSSGYAHNSNAGYFIRSWLHLDGNDLTFKEENADERSLSLELLVSISDSNGNMHETKSYQYKFKLRNADIAKIRENGIDLKTYLPVASPGYYYVNIAVQDKASQMIGSAYQFLDIPDLSKSNLSFSSILTLVDEKEESVLRSGSFKDDDESFNAMLKWQALKNSPALRIYKPGDRLDYVAFGYNINKPGKDTPQLTLQTTLFKDGRLFSEKKEEIDLSNMDRGILSIARSLLFDSKMEEGDYLLKFTIQENKPARGRPRVALQAIDFKLRNEEAKRDAPQLKNKNIVSIPTPILHDDQESSQQNGAEEGSSSPVIKVDVSLITVDVSVRDKAGSFVDDLSKDDFIVYNNRVQQKIDLFSQNEMPLDLALIVDSSKSERPYLSELQKIAATVLQRLNPQRDRVALFCFGSDIYQLTALTQDLRLVAHMLSKIPTIGGTNIKDALFEATQYLRLQERIAEEPLF